MYLLRNVNSGRLYNSITQHNRLLVKVKSVSKGIYWIYWDNLTATWITLALILNRGRERSIILFVLVSIQGVGSRSRGHCVGQKGGIFNRERGKNRVWNYWVCFYTSRPTGKVWFGYHGVVVSLVVPERGGNRLRCFTYPIQLRNIVTKDVSTRVLYCHYELKKEKVEKRP